MWHNLATLWRRETWWWNEHVTRPLLPSGQLSRPGRLVKALGHHTMQPNKMPDMQCTMLVKKPTRKSTRILTPSPQKYTALLTSLEERTLMLLVTNGSHESPEYYRNTGIPVKNIGIPVKNTYLDTNIGFNQLSK